MRARILLVEDEPAFAAVLTEFFVEEGFSVLHLRDGMTALNILATPHARRPDVIVCDVRLPGLRGDLLAKELRTRFPDVRLPVLLMSASADPQVDLRDVSFMPKPFDSGELVNRIRGMLEAPSRSVATPAN